MDKGTELEQAIFDVIQKTLRSDADVKAAKEYFKNTLVIDLIKEATD